MAAQNDSSGCLWTAFLAKSVSSNGGTRGKCAIAADKDIVNNGCIVQGTAPRTKILGKRRGLLEHTSKIFRGTRIPTGQIRVETMCTLKHR